MPKVKCGIVICGQGQYPFLQRSYDMNLSVHSPVPYHSQYPKASAANREKRNDSHSASLSFHDILLEKMKTNRERQPSGTNRITASGQV
ncbi:hypothetical protein DFP94_103211 [Fontibacillus phaseoli]|uniref:Uncharacterized protein n=1 Tax=Fontibacillus phaseoli TaxID=1416533 RepID=A0A369BG04_9BACL|nr:hypothetical protein DFP94_103211 [Fontibacillus phaseoli]